MPVLQERENSMSWQLRPPLPDDPEGEGADQTSAERAALDAVDTERLLAGEDPSSRIRDDALHWIDVYTELLEFKLRVLDESAAVAAEMSEPALAEISATDVEVLRAEADRFRERLEFWRKRLVELDGDS